LEGNGDWMASAREGVEQAAAASAVVAAARTGYENYLEASSRLAELEKRREARNELRARLAAVEHDLIEARSKSRLFEERLGEVAGARAELAELAGKGERQNSVDGA